MKKILLPVLFSFTVAVCRADGPYHFIKEIPVGGDGGWDYLSVDSAGQRLYVSHGTKVVVIDLAKDQVVGEITNTPGVHGIAVAPDLGLGITSNGREDKRWARRPRGSARAPADGTARAARRSRGRRSRYRESVGASAGPASGVRANSDARDDRLHPATAAPGRATFRSNPHAR